MIEPLRRLEPGMPIVFGGDRLVRVPEDLAASFEEGDRLVVVQDTGDLLHVPSGEWERSSEAVGAATGAFSMMASVGDEQIRDFFGRFAGRLAEDAVFSPIAEANDADVADAAARGRSTTRLALDERMRADMIEGLRLWAGLDTGRDRVIERVEHPGWTVEQVQAGLGVVGFVFEGRPNVFADATGVLASGNTVVFRIGSDALGTARAIMRGALEPALDGAGLPRGAVSLVDSPSRAAGWAMFSDPRLALAVARGSGAAVSQLGAVARQAGTPVSLHGTGGAWLVASESAKADHFESAVYHSLDRKVCNTLNTVCIVESRADELVPRLLGALEAAGQRRQADSKLHFTEAARPLIPGDWLADGEIVRAGGPVVEPRAEPISEEDLGLEWEWEMSPEVTLAIVPDVATAVELFNMQSPRFVASLISSREDEHQSFYDSVDAPFVGNGFTRWVDGQYALNRPELGLSTWQFGRLLGRGGVLSGDSVFTVRTRARQDDPDIGR